MRARWKPGRHLLQPRHGLLWHPPYNGRHLPSLILLSTPPAIASPQPNPSPRSCITGGLKAACLDCEVTALPSIHASEHPCSHVSLTSDSILQTDHSLEFRNSHFPKAVGVIKLWGHIEAYCPCFNYNGSHQSPETCSVRVLKNSPHLHNYSFEDSRRRRN